MKHGILLICLLLAGNSQVIWGQSSPDTLPPSIHVDRTYYPGTHQLARKFAYYFDHWSEQKVRHGLFSTWNKEGQLQQVAHYHHDTLNGVFEEYYANGQLKSRVQYTRGKLDGPVAFYALDGHIRKRGYYRAGTRHGNFIQYRRDGTERSRRSYEYGTRKKAPKVADS
ncbi:MAG: hypothetical protein AAFV07_17755 [Bacteroidota bacterium]